jgi:hypothetical protein
MLINNELIAAHPTTTCTARTGDGSMPLPSEVDSDNELLANLEK